MCQFILIYIENLNMLTAEDKSYPLNTFIISSKYTLTRSRIFGQKVILMKLYTVESN